MAGDIILGWDIGGAHLKVAALDGERVVRVACLPCPLWQGLDHLDRAFTRARAVTPEAPAHAVTMTGELSDCFHDRKEGVRSILSRFAASVSTRGVRIFGGKAGFLTPSQAMSNTAAVASANWSASGRFVATRFDDALFVDIGSTTTDLLPIRKGKLVATGTTDADRLANEELVYTGVARTSVMAMVATMRFRGRDIPVMAEHFATAADVYRLTGELPAGADLLSAADNGAKTTRASARRLARMIGRDAGDSPMREWVRCATSIAEVQLRGIEQASRRVASRARIRRDAPVVGAGVGRFLARKLADCLGRPYLDFDTLTQNASRLKARIADCAPAVAVALLLRDRE